MHTYMYIQSHMYVRLYFIKLIVSKQRAHTCLYPLYTCIQCIHSCSVQYKLIHILKVLPEVHTGHIVHTHIQDSYVHIHTYIHAYSRTELVSLLYYVTKFYRYPDAMFTIPCIVLLHTVHHHTHTHTNMRLCASMCSQSFS